MNVLIVGDFDKHDFVLTIAKLLQASTNQTVTVFSDRKRNYKYFNGEVSGVQIGIIDTEDLNESKPIGADIVQEFAASSDSTVNTVIFDWHSSVLPSTGADTKVILATNYERNSIEVALEIQKNTKIDGLLIEEVDCNLSQRFILSYLKEPELMFAYGERPRRKIEWVHDEKINFRGIENDFYDATNLFLKEILNISKNDAKALWSFVKKKG